MRRGERWRVWKPGSEGDHQLFCASSLRVGAVAEALDGRTVAAALADPPYSSGGLHASGRRQDPRKKYIQDGTQRQYLSFSGDHRDQRSFIRWSSEWMADLWGLATEETYLLVFTDWRQLPATTDAVQMAGWLWRGVAVWDKGLRARCPRKGYFRHQAEYVVWASGGALPMRADSKVCSGVLTQPIDRQKVHIAQKPVAVLRWLLSVVPPGDGVVVDPFGGSGTSVLAAEAEGLPAVMFEQDPGTFETALLRLDGEGFRRERL